MIRSVKRMEGIFKNPAADVTRTCRRCSVKSSGWNPSSWLWPAISIAKRMQMSFGKLKFYSMELSRKQKTVELEKQLNNPIRYWKKENYLSGAVDFDIRRLVHDEWYVSKIKLKKTFPISKAIFYIKEVPNLRILQAIKPSKVPKRALHWMIRLDTGRRKQPFPWSRVRNQASCTWSAGRRPDWARASPWCGGSAKRGNGAPRPVPQLGSPDCECCFTSNNKIIWLMWSLTRSPEK